MSMMQTSAEGQLSVAQSVRLAAAGCVLWFLAALAIRWGIPAGWFGRDASILLFAATLPLAWGLVWLIRLRVPSHRAQLVVAVAIASAAAFCCDAVALTWFPSLYGGTSAGLVAGAGWLFWGVFACLAAAIWMQRRTTTAA